MSFAYSSPGDFDPSQDGCGYRESVCNCLADSLAAIAAATASIALSLEKKSEKPCEFVDQCMEYIIAKLQERYEGPLRSCDECRQMVRSGLGGTFEFAIRCAGACIEETEKVCSAGDPSTWGKPCKGCGQEPCCCNAGLCEPCEEEPEKGAKFVGWCNRSTQAIIVLRQGAQSPGVGWEAVSLAETEQAAAIQAEANCKQPPYTPPIVTPHPEQPNAYPTLACNFSSYLAGTSPFLESGTMSLVQSIASQSQAAVASSNFGIGGLDINNVGQMFYGLMRYIGGGDAYLAGNFLPELVKVFGCDNPAFRKSLSALAEFQYINKAIGVDLKEFYMPYIYAANLACPTKFLEPDRAMAVYLSGVIGEKELTTLFGMHGYCAEATEWARRASRSKPIQLQLAMMRRRKLIEPSQYHLGMREIGFLEPATAEHLFTLTEQIPTMSDIIRFMVRDANDDEPGGVVDRFKLDDLFDRKYGKQLKQWSEMQGIPEQAARFAWRSHWGIPSPTQLFQFWHRLRRNPEYTTLETDIKEALIQQDILPFWHRHFMAVSYLPLGRIDIRRAYNIGAVKDDELIGLYAQLGYSDETCEKLADFTRRLRDRSLLGHHAVKQWTRFERDRNSVETELRDDGVPDEAIAKALSASEPLFANSVAAKAFISGDLTREQFRQRLDGQGVSPGGIGRLVTQLGLRIISHPALLDFAAGTLDENDARQQMREAGMNADIVASQLDQAERLVERQAAIACQRGVKRRYLLGDVTKGEAIDLLSNYGTTRQRAATLARNWDCEQSSRGKAVAASKLCDWLARGAIDAADFSRRLVNLGYTDTDAALMVEDCLIAISAKRLKQAEKQAKDDAALRQRQQKALQQAGAAVAREQARMQRLREAAIRTRTNRAKQMLGAVEKLTDRNPVDLFTATGFMADAKRRIEREYALHIDEALAVLLKSVEEWTGESMETLTDVINAMSVAAQYQASTDGDPIADIEPSINGSTQPSA